MSKQHLQPGDEFITIQVAPNDKITWRINEHGMPQIVNREDNTDGVS